MNFDVSTPAPDHLERNPQWPESSNPRRSRYPSDVTEDQWQRIERLLSRDSAVGRPPQHDRRDVVDAINYRWQTGCSWRMLPHDFPPWTTVYTHLRGWQRQGVLRQVRDILVRPPRQLPSEAVHQASGLSWSLSSPHNKD